MKKPILTIVLLIYSFFTAYCQLMYPLTFEDNDTNVYFDNIPAKDHLFIDTISNPNNIWQIGKPNKSIFNSAYSVPNAIITDTTHTYPINEMSSFIIKNTANYGFYFLYEVSIAGYYNVNTDTLTDYGKIEFSSDNGNTWIDLLKDTIYNSYIKWSGAKPVFSGNSNGWKHFEVDVTQLGPILNIHLGDTILYRFTFISDSIQTNKDGLMFDSFFYTDVVTGIDENNDKNINTICFPSPADRKITFGFEPCLNEKSKLIIFDSFGKIILSENIFNENKIELNTEKYKSGLYLYCLINEKDRREISKGKFIIQR